MLDWAPTWTVGERIRKAREDSRLRQADLAARLHVARATVANWENNSARPHWLIMREVATVTHVPMWWLLGLDGPPEQGDDGLMCIADEACSAWRPAWAA